MLAAGIGAGNAQEKVNPDNRPIPLRRPRPGEEGKLFGTNARMHVRTSGTLQGDWFHEDAREIPVAGDYDVIVAGGGPAGVAAALAAARSGASTLMIEVHGCVGGIWTAGMLCWILDAFNKPGIMAEILTRLEADKNGQTFSRDVGSRIARGRTYDPEAMKLLLEDMLLEAGVNIRLFTRIVGAVPDDQNRLAAVVTESKSGREVFTAKSFIDATGDGDLAAQAGCGFDFGRPGDGITQPFSLMALFHGVKSKDIGPFINHYAEINNLGRAKANLLEEFRSAGIDPSYAGPSIFEIHDGLYAMMANHQYGVSAINADDVSRATLEAGRGKSSTTTPIARCGAIIALKARVIAASSPQI